MNFVLFSTGMCVLAGCDFLPSVPGIGIAKAYALVSKYRNLERVSTSAFFKMVFYGNHFKMVLTGISFRFYLF